MRSEKYNQLESIARIKENLKHNTIFTMGTRVPIYRPKCPIEQKRNKNKYTNTTQIQYKYYTNST